MATIGSSISRRRLFRGSHGVCVLGTVWSLWWCSFFVFGELAVGPIHAAIVTTGDIIPSYPGGDPWNVGGILHVGQTSNGRLTINNGSDVINTDGSIGWATGATGSVTVTGVQSTWECIGNLSLGQPSNSGAGHLTVSSDGTIYVGDAARGGGLAGWLTISDRDSSGNNGGQLFVYNGSTLTHGRPAVLGNEADEHGWATVHGPGSTWTNGDILIGRYGTGTLTIQNGGTVSNSLGYLGYYSGSTGTVTVDGNGSTWTNGHSLHVGFRGSGAINIIGGGAVSNSWSYLGYYSGSTGTVTVDGNGSTWTNGQLFNIGYQGSGAIVIIGGGAVSSHRDGYLGYWAGSTGVATVTGIGSTWTNSSDLSVGCQGTGTLAITNGGLVSVGGMLTIDFDGNNDSFINMATGGMLALFGDAEDSLGDFLGLINGTDAIRYWENTISDWASITGAVPGVDFTLAYVDDAESSLHGYTLLTVGTIPKPVPGDANNDGRVDDADAKTLAAHWGQTGGWAQGDFNNDNVINALDVAILAANWGYSATTEQANTSMAVPEPTVLATLACLALLAGGRRRRVRSGWKAAEDACATRPSFAMLGTSRA